MLYTLCGMRLVPDVKICLQSQAPVQLTLNNEEDCTDVASKFKSFVETKMGFMLDINDVTCDDTADSGRRLLQAAPTMLTADLAGPLADSRLKEGLGEDAQGGLNNALQEDLGVSAVVVEAPDAPAAAAGTTLAPGVDPDDPEDDGGGSNRSLLTIILIACVAFAVVLCAIVGCLFCRSRSHKGEMHEVGSIKPHDTATYVSVDASVTQNSGDFSSAVPPPDQLSKNCLLYTSPSPRDRTRSRMPSSA